jgi:hypothetical protein
MNPMFRMPDPRIVVLAAVCALALPATADAAMVFPDGNIEREGLGDSGTTVQWRTPTVTGGSLQGTPNCDPDSGSVFATGTTKVDCLAAVKVCPPLQLCIIQLQGGSFTVKVTEGAGPALSGIGDVSVVAEPGRDTAAVRYPLPSATDPSGVAAGSVACSPASGSELPLGRTTVTCSARDTVGNASSAAFQVDVSPAPVVPTAPAEPGAPGAPEGPAGPATPAAPGAETGQGQRLARPVALGRRLRISRGVARVAVSCRTDNPVPCEGTLELQGARQRRVGRAKFVLAPGKTATMRVRLSRAARRTLSRRGQLRLKAIARTTDQSGAT